VAVLEVAGVLEVALVAVAEAVARELHPTRALSICKPTVVTIRKDIVEFLPSLHATLFRIWLNYALQIPPSSND